MKNRKGFTLVELLGVIVILAVIMTIAVPSTIGISNKLKTDMYCKKIDLIENAAKLYGEDIRDSLNTTGTTVTVKTLVTKKYLKKDQSTSPYIVDPRDKKSTALYNMSFTLKLKNNRVSVVFNSTVNTTCGK